MERINTGIGFEICPPLKNSTQYWMTGYPNSKILGHDYSTAYDFEDVVKKNIDCSDIMFDSESCQFFAYAETSERLERFANDIKEHFSNAKQLFEQMYGKL